MMKKILSALIVLVLGLVTLGGALAFDEKVPVEINYVKINGETYENGATLNVERGETLDIKVKLKALEKSKNLVVKAYIDGYEYSDYEEIEKATHVFDVKAGNTYTKELSLTIPQDLELEKTEYNEFYLRIEISNREDIEIIFRVQLDIDAPRHGLKIKEVTFFPANLKVKAGSALMAKVDLENFGKKDEKDVKVSISIPELKTGSATDLIDLIESDDVKSSEELFLKLPYNAKSGTYQVLVTALYDKGREKETKTFSLEVEEKESKPAIEEETKVIFTVGPESQNIVIGKEGAYPISLTNLGKTSKTFVLELTIGDWAESRLSESVLVVKPEQTKTATVFVKAKPDAPAGEHLFTLNLKSDETVIEQATLKANVVKEKTDWSGLRKGLEIALIVLVVILIIVGLVVGFSRLKGKESEEGKKEYY